MFLKNLSENDQAIGEKLRSMKIQLSRQGKITNVVEQNQHLRAELDLARIQSSRFKIRLQNIQRDKSVLEKKIKEVQSQSFNLGVRSPPQIFTPQTTGGMQKVRVPTLTGFNNLSSLGSASGGGNTNTVPGLKLPPKIPTLKLDKIKKVQPKKPTYQYIKKLEDSIKIITQKNNQLQDENFDLQEENRILQDTNNNLYEYGEKAKLQIKKSDQKIKLLEQKIQKLKRGRKPSYTDHNFSRSARTGGIFQANYLKSSTRDSGSNQGSGSKKQISFGFHQLGNNQEQIKHKIGGSSVSPIHQRKTNLPPISGKGLNNKIIAAIYTSGGEEQQHNEQNMHEINEFSTENNIGQKSIQEQQHEEFVNGVEGGVGGNQEHELSNISLPDSFADKELSFIKGFGVDGETSDDDESERIDYKDIKIKQ